MSVSPPLGLPLLTNNIVIGSVACSGAPAGSTTLYTVPNAQNFVVTGYVLRDPSAAFTSLICTVTNTTAGNVSLLANSAWSPSGAGSYYQVTLGSASTAQVCAGGSVIALVVTSGGTASSTVLCDLIGYTF